MHQPSIFTLTPLTQTESDSVDHTTVQALTAEETGVIIQLCDHLCNNQYDDPKLKDKDTAAIQRLETLCDTVYQTVFCKEERGCDILNDLIEPVLQAYDPIKLETLFRKLNDSDPYNDETKTACHLKQFRKIHKNTYYNYVCVTLQMLSTYVHEQTHPTSSTAIDDTTAAGVIQPENKQQRPQSIKDYQAQHPAQPEAIKLKETHDQFIVLNQAVKSRTSTEAEIESLLTPEVVAFIGENPQRIFPGYVPPPALQRGLFAKLCGCISNHTAEEIAETKRPQLMGGLLALRKSNCRRHIESHVI